MNPPNPNKADASDVFGDQARKKREAARKAQEAPQTIDAILAPDQPNADLAAKREAQQNLRRDPASAYAGNRAKRTRVIPPGKR